MSDDQRVVQWNRLEPRPRTQDFERSLRAEVRDPLWMLTRQWQMGELTGEDAGAPIFALLEYATTRLDALKLGDGTARRLDPEMPLEAAVEARSVDPASDLELRIEMGRHWLRMLRRRLGLNASDFSEVERGFRRNEALQFRRPPTDTPEAQYEHAHTLSNPRLYRMLAAAEQGVLVDGRVVYDHARQPSHKASDLLIPTASVGAARKAQIDAVGQEFVAWFEHVYSQPSDDESAWHPSRLEYAFDCAAPGDSGAPLRFTADEYPGGRLDWYSMDYGRAASDGLVDALEEGLVIESRASFIPTGIEFPGMPQRRWWEFEDARMNFGRITAAATDTGKLVFAEFGTVFGNDWSIVPLPLPASSVSRVRRIVVTDVFEQRTIVRHVQEQSPDEPWAFHQIHDRSAGVDRQNDPRLLLPPVVDDTLQSEPIERVSFIRDEMANMVWGIETIVPSGCGDGTDGFEHALRVRDFLAALADDEDLPPLANEALIRYRIATDVPENWIPFIPVKIGFSSSRQIQLQRGAMPRILPGLPTRRIRPRTTVLREGLDRTPRAPFYVFEEEVPRAGVTVTLRWQRCRWYNGRTVVWLARRKQTGRGEGQSGLRFDSIADRVPR